MRIIAAQTSASFHILTGLRAFDIVRSLGVLGCITHMYHFQGVTSFYAQFGSTTGHLRTSTAPVLQ